MNAKRVFVKLTNPIRQLFHRERTDIGKERLALLLVCYIPIMIIGVMTNFLGLTEPSASFFNYTHTLCVIAAAVVLCLYFKKKIGIKACLGTFTIIGQVIISIEMVYCALHPTHYYIVLIMANTVLLALNAMVAVSAYMKYNTIILGCSTLAIYITCAIISGEAILQSFIAVFTIVFCFVILVGVLVSTTTNKLEKDNQKFKHEEIELLHLLSMKREEVIAFLSLSAKKYNHDGTKVLLERLSTKAKLNLLNNIDEYMKTRKTDLDTITKVFPEFTPSEREICRLILQGKKQTDICLILNKNESNINSQRANMRRKLKLNPSDNLQSKLQERMEK